MSDINDKKPVTVDVMRAYVSVLEKQVQQMTLVVTTLEELNDKLEKVEGHFHNGFKSDITSHITDELFSVKEKLEKSLIALYIVKDNVEKSTSLDKSLNDKAHLLSNDIKDKIADLKGDVSELKTSIKIDRATNLIGLGTFVLGLVTIILKMFGKI